MKKRPGNNSESFKKNKWKPGQSGNPAGRPKGTRLTDFIRKVGEETHPDAKQKGMSRFEVVARGAFELAEAGDMSAVQFIAERADGKVKDVVKWEGERRLPQLSDQDLANRMAAKAKIEARVREMEAKKKNG